MTHALLSSLELVALLMILAFLLRAWVRSFANECLKMSEDANSGYAPGGPLQFSGKRSLLHQRIIYRPH